MSDAGAIWSLAVTDELPADAKAVILQGIIAFNDPFVGPADHRPLAVLVRDKAGAVLGGLAGETGRGWLRIHLFYLPEMLRGAGLGRRVIASAEAEAIRRGCANARVETASFQARGFYEKQGYRVFGDIAGYPNRHRLLFLQKALPGADKMPA
jgi:GNAT superfamily N-acetyltransferase